MKKILIGVSTLFIAAISACNSGGKPQLETPQHHEVAANQGLHEVKVVEVLQTTQYTYLKVTEKELENWIAVSKIDAKVGDIFYFDSALPMQNFQSKELDRTFDMIYFVDRLTPEGQTDLHQIATKYPSGKKPEITKDDIKIEPLADGITIAELFENKNNYNGKTVKVKGKVTKYNEEIMKRNWVHIQDGTQYNDEYDLTVTTQEKVNVGDVVVFEGVFAIDKDFGAGYSYKAIVEKAILIK